MVFTCVTDTGRIIWEIINSNNRQSFHSTAHINMSITVDIFTLTLVSVTNNSIYRSTAVAHNIPVDYNNVEISCIDGAAIKLSIIIGNKNYTNMLIETSSCQLL